MQKLSDDEQLQQRICQDFLSVTDLDKVKDPAKLSLIQSTVFTFFGATLEFGMTVFPGLRSKPRLSLWPVRTDLGHGWC